MSHKEYWFKAKNYGWGWYPARWQGWVVLIIYIGLMVWNFNRIDGMQHSGSDTLLNFIPQTVLLTFILIGICFKTGEKPEWRWGKKH